MKIKAKPNIEIQQILSSSLLSLSDVKNYLRDSPFSSVVDIVNLHLLNGTHWASYINQNYFDSCGSSPPEKLTRFFKNEMGIGYILITKSKVSILFVQRIVYL